MNHAIVTATVPVPAKLYLNLISTVFLSNLPVQTEEGRWMEYATYKNPVLTPHVVTPGLLIINGVQKLNMMPMRLELARDQAAVRALRRCAATSAE